MDENLKIIERDEKKRKRIWIIIVCCLCIIPILTYFESRIFRMGTVDFPVTGNVLVFVLINVNLLLMLLMVFLVLRNMVQLIFDRRQGFLGAKLRTKLVISFVFLSLIPTSLLFFIALQFVSTSMDYWFNINVEQSLVESLNIARTVYQDAKDDVGRNGRILASELESRGNSRITGARVEPFLLGALEKNSLAALELVSNQRIMVSAVYSEAVSDLVMPDIPSELMRRALAGETGLVAIQEIVQGELVRGLAPVLIGPADSFTPSHVLITSLLISRDQLKRMGTISQGLEGYRQLMILKVPIKSSLLVILLIVTLLIIFSAIWFGFYVSRGLTGPIAKLADATRRVSEGELDFVLEKDSGDEMGTLVDAFNRMIKDLLTGKQRLEETHVELEQRRRYMEILLQNVPAGVISMDKGGHVTTVNRFAEELLDVSREEILFKDYRAVMRPAHARILEEFFAELDRSGKASIERNLQLTVENESFSLRVNFTRLEDEDQSPLGVVIVFDNLTELEKAQRMAAWREVARRIAHEIKNPLTPIGLSAQRLRKRYLKLLESEGEVFDLCTATIINQVDELKRLVSEFSSFARMPAVRKSMSSLSAMVEEVVALYREAHKNIVFSSRFDDDMPVFLFDVEQMKRVLINLFDNAVAEVGKDGKVDVLVYADLNRDMVYMEVADNGQGVKDEDKLRLFEPYFSKKKSGTGLGLAIATTIVADHGGYIRVKDNKPAGARFIIELPLVME
ncbi:MAG: HAMP domain-containing protein [Desulfobulbaceae bacterium]|nr:HAMP domain-containing protein [Desulfobulbaceae bacterium]